MSINEIEGIENVSPDEKSDVAKLIDTVSSARMASLSRPEIQNNVDRSIRSTSSLRRNQLKPSNIPSMNIMFTKSYVMIGGIKYSIKTSGPN